VAKSDFLHTPLIQSIKKIGKEKLFILEVSINSNNINSAGMLYSCPSLMKGQNKMKTKKFFLLFTFSVVLIFTYPLFGQVRNSGKQDSSQNITQDDLKGQQSIDKERMDNAKDAKKQTKANSKRTQQVNRDAMDASRESSKAYRDEKKAQKARAKATKQNDKAVDARNKSDRN
jgi:hypothetical protein